MNATSKLKIIMAHCSFRPKGATSRTICTGSGSKLEHDDEEDDNDVDFLLLPSELPDALVPGKLVDLKPIQVLPSSSFPNFWVS